jgi:hypothetical protein
MHTAFTFKPRACCLSFIAWFAAASNELAVETIFDEAVRVVLANHILVEYIREIIDLGLTFRPVRLSVRPNFRL